MPLIVATLVLVPAAFLDVRYHRIPNLLSLGGFVVGCVMHGVLGGLLSALVAGGAGLLLMVGLFVFFIFGWMGAGDVKLIAAVGAICGTINSALIALVAIVVTGALMGLFVLAWRKGLGSFVQRLGAAVSISVISKRPMYIGPENAAASAEMPYAVAIALGGLLALIAQTFEVFV